MELLWTSSLWPTIKKVWLAQSVTGYAATHTPCSVACWYAGVYSSIVSRGRYSQCRLKHSRHHLYSSQIPTISYNPRTSPLLLSAQLTLQNTHFIDSVELLEMRSVTIPSFSDLRFVYSVSQPLSTHAFNISKHFKTSRYTLLLTLLFRKIGPGRVYQGWFTQFKLEYKLSSKK